MKRELNQVNDNQKIIIVGAGLCGSLLAIRMAERGYKVDVYERMPDMRAGIKDAGRSINLALSARGLKALEKEGLKSTILEECIPMRGRMIHPLGGEEFLSPYSGRETDYINSVSRPGLNIMLLKEAGKRENITLHFNTKVTKVDLENASITYTKNGETHSDSGKIVIGTDGAGSVVRKSMMGQTTKLLFNYSQDFLRSGYKELSILPGENNTWKIHKEALHIWPRDEFMIIALPNIDGSFTLTMFHPFGGEEGFNALQSREKRQAFFQKYYPDLLTYIPHYQEEYEENPTATLGTIKCFPWQAYGKALIMGDASHAIVPFYGQGMNSSLEDVRVFDELMDNHDGNWDTLFKKFEKARVVNCNAIADLAIDNFHEMKDHVNDVAFMRKRKIEMQLEQQFPDYYSKYSLVTFKANLSYSEAMNRGRAQDKMLLELCSNDNFDQVQLSEYYEKLMNIELA